MLGLLINIPPYPQRDVHKPIINVQWLTPARVQRLAKFLIIFFAFVSFPLIIHRSLLSHGAVRGEGGGPRCRLGSWRWGSKRDLMVEWIREILVTMLNNYSSSRDQSSIDWTPQAFNTERKEGEREWERESLGKQRLVNSCSGRSGARTCGLARKRVDKKMYPLGELRLAFVTGAGDPFERSDNSADELVRERCQRRSRWYLSVLRRLIDRPEFNVCKAPSLSGGFQSELFISHVIKKFWHAWLPLIFRARVSRSLLSAILPQAFSASLAQISGIVWNQIVVTMRYSRIWYWMSRVM